MLFVENTRIFGMKVSAGAFGTVATGADIEGQLLGRPGAPT
jgi:hypothetical protein